MKQSTPETKDIKRGAFVEVPSYNREMWLSLAASLFEVMGAGSHDESVFIKTLKGKHNRKTDADSEN